MTHLTEQQKARAAGYIFTFIFEDGHVHCEESPERIYPISTVQKQPYPCYITQTIVYRFETPDGFKAIAILDFFEQCDE